MNCPECNGTGTYVGLNSAEPCRECTGYKITTENSADIINYLTYRPPSFFGKLTEIRSNLREIEAEVNC